MARAQQNHFELFGIKPAFELDSETLSLRYRELQKAAHPDRFAGASDSEQRLALEQAAQINEAYRILKSPLLRARYLLELGGIPFDDNAAMEPSFLMQQMELREALAGIKGQAEPFDALSRLRDRIEGGERELVAALQAAFAAGDENSLQQAADTLRKMQFMQKLLQELDELEEGLVHF